MRPTSTVSALAMSCLSFSVFRQCEWLVPSRLCCELLSSNNAFHQGGHQSTEILVIRFLGASSIRASMRAMILTMWRTWDCTPASVSTSTMKT